MIKSILRISRGYVEAKYNKLKVSRLPGQEFVVFLKDDTTISQLFEHIISNLKLTNTNLLAFSAFTSQLQNFPVTPEIKEANEEIKEQPFLPLMLANDLFIYEVRNDKAFLIYGLECLELNPTNNRNLPEKIQFGIIRLSQEWETARTISQALLMPSTPNLQDPQLVEERDWVMNIFGKTVGTMQMLSGLKMSHPLNEFVKKMTLLMGANWIFLFGITYGLYGWDVGQPISYLTTVGVDLLALLRVFDLQKRVANEQMHNEGRWMGLLNLLAHRRMQRWLHCYLRRQMG